MSKDYLLFLVLWCFCQDCLGWGECCESQLCWHWLFTLSSSLNQHVHPRSWWLYCHIASTGRTCCWFRSGILFSLDAHMGNSQRNFGIWHTCPWQIGKKLLQSELPAEVDYLGDTAGDGCLPCPACACSTKVLGKCVRHSRGLCIDVSGSCCTSSGTLAVCWHSWAQFLCLSCFFYQLSQGFSSSSEKHPNKTLKTWGAGENKSCSWPSSKSQFWAVKCKFLRRHNMFL